jgi:Arc/MetJ-type ribon-helix-helix transcriptional regulator
MARRTRISVDLSGELGRWLLREVEAGGFGNPAEYIRHLVKAARASSSVQQIEARLIASEESGLARRMTARDWNALARRAEARIAALREGRAPRERRKSA